MRKMIHALGLVAGLFLAFPSFAAEVLVLDTATNMTPTPLSARQYIALQNLGPAPIYCQRGATSTAATTGLVVAKAHEVRPRETWIVPAASSAFVYCIAAAQQVTGAATSVEQGLAPFAASARAEGFAWNDGTSPTARAAGAYGAPLYAPDGRVSVTLDHPKRFSCSWTGSATTSTAITNCAAPGASLSYYIEGASIMGGVATGATAAALLQSGTGGTCGTATATHLACQHGTTGGCVFAVGAGPIKAVANGELCITSGETGTKWVNVWGYIAP
jgi:hypothetical protein